MTVWIISVSCPAVFSHAQNPQSNPTGMTRAGDRTGREPIWQSSRRFDLQTHRLVQILVRSSDSYCARSLRSFADDSVRQSSGSQGIVRAPKRSVSSERDGTSQPRPCYFARRLCLKQTQPQGRACQRHSNFGEQPCLWCNNLEKTLTFA